MNEYIDRLRELLKEASKMLEQSKSEFALNPKDFSFKLTVATFETQVKELENQYVAYNAPEK